MSLRDFRWQQLNRFHAISIIILLPIFMGSTFSHMAANRVLCFFVLQGSLGGTKPSKGLSVFAVKLQWNGAFRWLAEAWFFVVACLGCFLSKLIFELHFLHFSVFAIRPKRNAQFSKCGPALFWLILQLCVSLQTYSIKMKHWNCKISPQDFGITISLTWIA